MLFKYNSTIGVKKRQLDCGCFDFPFSKNRCKLHAYIEDSLKRINEQSDEENEKHKSVGSNAELNRWFSERRNEMIGFCKNCGGKSCKNDDEYFRFSIAHILPKAYFPSVATHEDNWIELCFWKNNCHGNMDNKILDLTDMSCWDEIVVKFQKMYNSIAPKERKRIPNTLLEYLNTDL